MWWIHVYMSLSLICNIQSEPFWWQTKTDLSDPKAQITTALPWSTSRDVAELVRVPCCARSIGPVLSNVPPRKHSCALHWIASLQLNAAASLWPVPLQFWLHRNGSSCKLNTKYTISTVMYTDTFLWNVLLQLDPFIWSHCISQFNALCIHQNKPWDTVAKNSCRYSIIYGYAAWNWEIAWRKLDRVFFKGTSHFFILSYRTWWNTHANIW